MTASQTSLEDELRRLRISNLVLEDRTRELQTELIRIKATQNRVAEQEINRLSQAYAILERETAELRERLVSSERSDSAQFPTANPALALLSQRLESEQRLVKQLQDRLALVSAVSDPLERALRGDMSLFQAAELVACLSVAKQIDQIAQVSETEIFADAVSRISELLPMSACRELLEGLLPHASCRSALIPLVKKCSEILSRNFRAFFLSDQTTWLECVSETEDIEEVISMFRFKGRPEVSLAQEYDIMRKFGNFRALHLVALLRGGEPEQRLCLLRCALNDATHFLASEHATEAASLVSNLSAKIDYELQNMKKI